jgi:hypothetical protein
LWNNVKSLVLNCLQVPPTFMTQFRLIRPNTHTQTYTFSTNF